jgi:transcription elongation factor GreB
VSKAFTRESDDAPEGPSVLRPAAVLPPGAKNYVTPDGARRWRAELERLEQQGAAADSSALGRLRRCLASIVVVETPAEPHLQVRFGANVILRDRTGAEFTYRIVGVDEADIDRDWVSWLSPIAKALMNRSVGETVRFRVPAGERVWEIVRVTYEPPP